ncbi:Pimeloyl-ACP methyl ester carboxylesterase [Formivibrio citricus]|uniref:Pimeloyl-ACP methyl ester carboxylesterase n=1 Tax=Formivibrio citricus TaxID=83765 RepID=A0A1I4VR56_9NEIS|nr:alpha/beta hydrolase [Formivibrio citricus]SFN03499.1 Pimeloyl-ACP methyl ester carboxylesterase [Formivibrio citricus]
MFSTPTFDIRQKSRTETIPIRGLRYNIRHWGPANAPVVFFLHGWMDASPTFQFLVDALQQDWHVIAPDWRGYGESEWLSRPYWFPDYYADLETLLNHFSPHKAARIVAHSMGANIASNYAGVRPERVSQLVMLDFLGLKPPTEDDSPTLIGRWIDHIHKGPRPITYRDHEAFAHRLMEINPRLTEARAHFLSHAMARYREEDGRIEMTCDPWHRIAAPALYHVEDSMASWQRITAPVLKPIAQYGLVKQRFGHDPDEYRRRLGSFRNAQVVDIPDSGHNVQHDQPELVAAAIEEFLTRD